MRRLLPCLAVASLAAADPAPAAFIPAEATVAVQLPDLARSRGRWPRTPYPRLLDTGWGRMLLAEWGNRLEHLAPGAGQVLDGLRVLAIGVQTADGGPRVTVAAEAGPLLPVLLTGRVPGHLTVRGAVVAWAREAAPQVGVARLLADAEADAAVDLHPPGAPAIHVDLRLDAVGLRETAVCAPTAATRLAAATPRTWADAQELRRLPATTLCAATWQGDPALAGGLPGLDAERLAGFERALASFGLPGWAETCAACSGPSTVWLAEGVPFPTLTAALSIDEVVARRWIAAATAKLNLAATAEGAAGFVGLLPLAIGRSPDGRLIITTEAQGVALWGGMKPGFAEHKGVAEVLTAAPSRSLLLAASRGGASWAVLAQLSVPLFTGMGAPQAISLPVDLRAASDRGWLYLRLLEDGSLRSEAGGLFGGPLAISGATAIAVPATIWLQDQLRRERKVPAPPEPEPPPSPVF